MESLRIIGTLCAFAETGSEGIHWTFLDNSMVGYEALNNLEDGDYLFIEDGNGGIEWEGEIKFDYESLRQPIPMFPHLIYQRLLGCTVHGIQVGVDPLKWFEWFSTDRPAVLIKRIIENASINR
jgi:hypothetical protein